MYYFTLEFIAGLLPAELRVLLPSDLFTIEIGYLAVLSVIFGSYFF